MSSTDLDLPVARPPKATVACLTLLLGLHAVLLAVSGWWQSPTLNEPAHLVAGLYHWKTGDFSLYRVNPPLVRLVASLPGVVLGYEEDWSGYNNVVGARPVFGMGEDFIAANGRRSMLLMRWARWALIPLSLLGAWVCFAWARDLFGNAAGLMAAALWCFSPMVLGHASMIAPDAHATSLGLAACYTFWRWLRRPTWQQAIVTGIVLGLAELAKSTLILFYPLWPVLWIAYRWRDRHGMTWRRWRDEAGMLVLRMVIGIYVLNLGYLGEGSFTQLKEFHFRSELFGGADDDRGVAGNRFAESWLGMLPVPFPANYVIGFDVQQRDFENFGRPSYLRGEFQEQGWWYYYGYAMLVKAPLGTLGLIGLALVTLPWVWGQKLAWRDAMILLSPAIVIFGVASMKSGFSHHSRYVLPCVPFVFIAVSGLGTHLEDLKKRFGTFFRDVRGAGAWRHSIVPPFVGLSTLGLLVASIASSLAVYPHSLSHFNQLAGGPENGAEHLLHSNIDWGQDLLFLEEWICSQSTAMSLAESSESLSEKGSDPLRRGQKLNEVDSPPKGQTPFQIGSEPPVVYLAFYNYYNPFVFEIDQIAPWPFRRDMSGEVEVPEGVYAISVNLLYEYPWSVRDRDGRRYAIDQRPLGYLRRQEPIGRAGYSIRIYSAEQVRSAYAAPATTPLWNGR